MSRTSMNAPLLAVALVVAQSTAFGCGENQFNMGQGLQYRGYLAPRPATVLVFDDGAADRKALYSGLARAGHKVTLVASSDAAARALTGQKFDVVIADFSDVDAVSTSTSGAVSVLPVVDRASRNQPDLRQRFAHFLLDGASLGQYLKSIDQVIKARPR